MSLLQVERLSKQFGNLAAVSDVSLTVGVGELRAVIGPNGAGKTTFFNMVSGMLSPTSGRVIFDNKDVTGVQPERRVAMGMARTFQITEVFPELTVRENLRIAVEVASGHRLRLWQDRASAQVAETRVEQLLALGKLAGKADRRVGELSHGDQRATEILMSISLNPRLLLLDEPTAGMGDQETYDIARLIRQLHREERLSIILIEHDMRVVFNLADRILVLAEGKMLADGTPQEIAANEQVQAAYLGDSHGHS